MTPINMHPAGDLAAGPREAPPTRETSCARCGQERADRLHIFGPNCLAALGLAAPVAEPLELFGPTEGE